MTVVRLAVLGDPIAHSRSPDLHRAALAALGLEGDARALRTPAGTLAGRLAELTGEGVRGVNLTHPLKQEALTEVARLSDRARRARSVNTVGLDRDGWWGDTTDGAGFVDLLGGFGRAPEGERVVIVGAGGAARSIALALIAAGCAEIAVSARRPDAATPWSAIAPVRFVAWRSPEEAEALAAATLVVQATPLGGDESPAPLPAIARRALRGDRVYGAGVTPWVERARAEGREAYDGLGLLVHQARHALTLILGRTVPLEPLARAVGWPR